MDIRDRRQRCRSLTKALGGHSEVAAIVGKGEDAVRACEHNGAFTAAWFVPLRDAGRKSGVTVDESLFGWVSAGDKK